MKTLIKRSLAVLALGFASLAVTPVLADESAHQATHEVAEGSEHPAGGEHGEHAWDTTSLLASCVNFAVLLTLFVFLFKDSLSSFLKKRRAEIEDQLQEAARLKAEAEAKHKEYSQRLAQLDSELAKVKADMIASGKAERDRIIADAEHKAARMRHEAQFLIDQYAKQLRVDLSREASESAIGAAEELLLRATTTYDQQRLSQEYLTALTKKGDADTGARPSLAPQSESRV